MYKYTAILYIIFIKILVGNGNDDDDNDYNSSIWLLASKDLENKSDDLRDALCEMMKLMGSDCNEELIRDMRAFFITTENIRKTSKLYELFALNFLNEGIVGCLKTAVTAVVRVTVSATTDGAKCAFKPVIDLIMVSIKLTLKSVMLLRNVHGDTKNCLIKRPETEKIKCLIAVQAKVVKDIVKALIELLMTVTKAILFLSGGIAARLTKCSATGAYQGLKQLTITSAKLGKCIFCAFTRKCK